MKKTKLDRIVKTPRFRERVQALLDGISAPCKCGREAHEHYIEPARRQKACPGFSIDLDRASGKQGGGAT